MSDKRKKERGKALKSRLSGPSESDKTAEEEETEETVETAENSETSESMTTSETAETAESSEMAESMTTSETSETSESEAAVKDRKNVNMYLPEDLVGEMNIRYSELDAKYQREHGRTMEKNRDYYSAVIEAGLTDKSIEDVLDLE